MHGLEKMHVLSRELAELGGPLPAPAPVPAVRDSWYCVQQVVSCLGSSTWRRSIHMENGGGRRDGAPCPSQTQHGR